MKYAFLCGGSALAVAASLCAPQAVAATATAAATTPGTVSELVVVAEKRAESIERVPVAVTAFSAKQRKVMGIESTQDLSNFVPSLSWTTTDDRIYIRGIGRNSDNLNNTSGVAIYYNGIYYGANAAVELVKDDLFIGNVEVDAGPQNTLHGSNADGGVINYTSQRPTSTPYAEVRAGAGNYNRYYLEGVVSGPINDHLKFRLGGNFTSMRGGYFDNLDGAAQGGDSVLGGSGQTEYIEAQLEGHWDHFDLWTMVSSGDFAANTRGGGGGSGNIPSIAVLSGAFMPNEFYGLCAPSLLNAANTANCAASQAPVTEGAIGALGLPAVTYAGFPSVESANPLRVTANQFPGNNPGNVNPFDFISESNSINDLENNIQVSINATYHFPDFDLSYLGGYQQFHYVLHIQQGSGAGLSSYTEAGLNPANATNAALCTGSGFTLAQCEQPLTVAYSGFYETLFNEYDQSFSHELNITSTTDSPFQYIGGVYWYHERWNQPVYSNIDPNQPQMGTPYYMAATPFSNALAPFVGGAATAELLGCEYTQVCPLKAAPLNPTYAGSSELTAINYDSVAGYAQGIYKFNDQWKVTGAIRYTFDHKGGWQEWRFIAFDGGTLGAPFSASTYGGATPALDLTALATASSLGVGFPGAGPAFINPNTGYAERKLSVEWGEWTGEADVDWTPDPSTLVYAKYSRGYKSGGWSTYTLGADPETEPEFVDAFEVGAKKTEASFTVNGDVFYYNYYNDQVPESVYNGATGQVVPILANVPLVRDYGVELSAFWRPIDPLTLSLAYSYLNATVAEGGPCVEDTVDPYAVLPGAKPNGCPTLASGAQTQSLKGEQLPAAIPNKVTFNAIYTWNFNPGNLALSGTFIWKDAAYDSIFNRYYSYLPSYTQVNLRAMWTGADNKYNVILYCNNLFNTLGYEGAAGTLLAANDILTGYTYSPPRTFGIELEYRWQ